MIRQPIPAIAASALLGLCFFAASGQTQRSVWDGIYSSAQAARGESAYAKDCASCHGAKMEGKNQAPPLAGTEFMMNWNGTSVGDLFDKMQTSMPGDQPGRLSPGANAEILSYMLKANQFPAGERDLESDLAKLKQIRFEADKPKR
jgi:S-disulfanyl-L-cysteine oxidoreductase SoxD